MWLIKVKIRKKQIFFFLLILTYALRALTDAVFVAKGEDSYLVWTKYITLVLAAVYGTIYLSQISRKWKCRYILRYVTIAAGTFGFISVLKMIYTGVFSSAVLEIVFHMIFPAYMAVLTINIGDSDDIFRCFSKILCITFFVYCVFEIGLSLFSSEYFSLISFADSYSPFESHYTSGTAAALCAYFAYYRKNKILSLLSLLFAFLTFKRFIILYCLVLYILPMFVNARIKLSRWIPVLLAGAFCVLTWIYYWLLIPANQNLLQEAFPIESVGKFTSGRSNFFAEVYHNSFFVNFGWGSCEAHLGRLLEMDLIQILVELSAAGLIVFSFCYWCLTGTTLYSLAYMAFQFLNMLTSHSLSGGFIWLLVLTTLAQIESDTESPKKRKRRIRVRL